MNRVAPLLEENDIRNRIAEGDETAFTELFAHYYSLLLPFVSRFTHSEADAEEVLQETFVRVWLSREQLPDIDNLRGWIYTIASRQCLMILRANLNNKKKLHALYQQSPKELVQDNASLAEITRLVGEAVSQMPAQRQRIYRLSREAGLKPQAIAVELSLSVSTVKNVLVLALKEIRSHLEAAGHVFPLIYLLLHFF